MPINDMLVTATLGANLLVAIVGLYMIFRKVAQTHIMVNSRMDEFKELLTRTAVRRVNQGIAEGVAEGIAQGINTGRYPDNFVNPPVPVPAAPVPEAPPAPAAEPSSDKPVTATITIKETR